MASAGAAMTHRLEDFENLFAALKPFLADQGKLAADVVVGIARAAFVMQEQIEGVRQPMQALRAMWQAEAQLRGKTRTISGPPTIV